MYQVCWGKGGYVTSAGWQVQCDPIWYVSSRSGDRRLRLQTAIRLFTFTFTRKYVYKIQICHIGYCYEDLAVFCLICLETIANAHLAYLRRDGQAVLVLVTGLNTKMVYSVDGLA